MSRTNQLTHHYVDGDAVIYVMSRDQRVQDNHALLTAQHDAIEQHLPLIVLFNVYSRTGFRSREHYDFMQHGLLEVSRQLATLNIPFIMRTGNPVDSIRDVLHETRANHIHFDFSPLGSPRKLVENIAKTFIGSTYVTDTHNIVPTWITSDKQEFAARTIRPKIHRLLVEFMIEPDNIVRHPFTYKDSIRSLVFDEIATIVGDIPHSGIVIATRPGEQAAHQHLCDFLKNNLKTYALQRNDIASDHQSGLSPYLHFGQISALRVALETMKIVDEPPLLFVESQMAHASAVPSTADGMNALFEEMIVRKELSDNFCYYNQQYLSLDGAHNWARKTLDEHRSDKREFTYTVDEWEQATTHDAPWNAAQNQLRRTGNIHGYMRMYWAKKILEWSATPEQALATCIYLNDNYSIDGGDPNGYVGILWAVAGLHDRAWAQRAVFGKIRYMNAAGLARKFDVDAYIEQWS